MASRQIEYIWKIARPRNEAIARALMYAAYKTAIETDPNTVQVLIRYYIHPSTRTRGRYQKDEPHINISVKNQDTQREQKYQSSHVYTSHLHSFNVVRVKPGGVEKPDSTVNAWPTDLSTKARDSWTGEPGLLGPKDDFITWPSEETGE